MSPAIEVGLPTSIRTVRTFGFSTEAPYQTILMCGMLALKPAVIPETSQAWLQEVCMQRTVSRAREIHLRPRDRAFCVLGLFP